MLALTGADSSFVSNSKFVLKSQGIHCLWKVATQNTYTEEIGLACLNYLVIRNCMIAH
jgi:hypothetical protein